MKCSKNELNKNLNFFLDIRAIVHTVSWVVPNDAVLVLVFGVTKLQDVSNVVVVDVVVVVVAVFDVYVDVDVVE